MYQRNYEVQVLVNNNPVKEYIHDGNYFIEGRKDTSFKIKIKNNGSQRIIVVPTVDGLSVMDGKTASKNSPGYVVDGHDSIIVDGWRVSKNEISTFVFCGKEKSYAARTGKGDGNQGIIGVAVFREQQKMPAIFDEFRCGQITTVTDPISPLLKNNNKTYASSCCSQEIMRGVSTKGIKKNDLDLGAGWGELKNSEAFTVEIEREPSPDTTFQLYYATKSALKKMGVNVDENNNIVTAFPGDFCKPPQE